MTVVVFYEKPGCKTNAQQKTLLRAWGNELKVRDLISEPWTEDSLGRFFRGEPEPAWLNPAAPALRNAGTCFKFTDRAGALAAMIADPLLIRRPLLRIGEIFIHGFDPAILRLHLKVGALDADMDLQACMVNKHDGGEQCDE